MEHLEHRTSSALESQIHPLDYLRLLLEDEELHRKNARAKRLISRARFRHDCDLEDWDDSFDRGISKAKMKDIAKLNFFKAQENLVILGKTGEGKTHIAMSIGKKLCTEGFSSLFFSVNLLFEEILASKASGNYLKMVKKITKSPVLILDDFGLRNYTHDEATSLIDIIEERYQKGVIIVTSQVSPKGWPQLFEDPVIAEAIVDRLTKPSLTLKLKGGSYLDRLGKKVA